MCLLGSSGGSGGGTAGGNRGGGGRSTISSNFREGDFDAELAVVDVLLVNGIEGLLLVVGGVELNETKPFAALVVLADNVGSLDVHTLENLRQTCVIYAEGEIGHKQGVDRRCSGSTLGIVAGGTGGPGTAGGTTRRTTSVVVLLVAVVVVVVVVLGAAVVVASIAAVGGTAFLVSGTSPPETASAAEGAAATACTSSSATLTGGGTPGLLRGVGILGGLLLARAGNLDVDLTSVDELLVEEFHRLLGLLLGLHLDKAVAKGAGPTGNDARGSYFSCSLKLLGEVSVIGLER